MPSTKVNRRKIHVKKDERAMIKPIPQTLLDLRGSIPVSGKQDFDAIRTQVLIKRAKQRCNG